MISMYLRKVPYNWRNEDLVKFIHDCADVVVTTADVKLDRETGRSKGFAFVSVRPEDEDAVLRLQGADVGKGLRLIVERSVNQPK